MKFTLGKLFLAVTMLALACAGMIYRNDWWAGSITMLTWLLFVWTGMQAIVQHQRKRVTRIAFLMAGASYLLLSANVWYGLKLPTNIPIAIISQKLEVGGIYSGVGALKNIIYAAYGFNLNSFPPEQHEFFLVGHCVFSWLFAAIAAWVAGWMYDRQLITKSPATF